MGHTFNFILFLVQYAHMPPLPIITYACIYIHSSGSTLHSHVMLQEHAACLRHVPDISALDSSDLAQYSHALL